MQQKIKDTETYGRILNQISKQDNPLSKCENKEFIANEILIISEKSRLSYTTIIQFLLDTYKHNIDSYNIAGEEEPDHICEDILNSIKSLTNKEISGETVNTIITNQPKSTEEKQIA
jgi:capsid portal protein